MKALLSTIAFVIVCYVVYKQNSESAPPLVIDSPIYGEMRATAVFDDRELEMAVFTRASSQADCEARVRMDWEAALENCESCKLHEPVCRDQLAPRYARLFEDRPIPSAYLSATAGTSGERDGRLVVYGLTDEEGVAMCESLRTMVEQNYKGTLRCIAPSGG